MIHTEVLYNDPEHRYYLGQVVYRSSTQIVEQFVDHFDVEEMSTWMEYRYGNTKEYWKDKWKKENSKSLDRGNMIHQQREDYLYGRGLDRINNKDFEVHNRNLYSENIDYFLLPDGVWPELKLWRHDWRIAGRVDKPIIETILGKRYFHIDDYKTNKAVNKESYYAHRDTEKRKKGYVMMTGPLSHLMDCEFSHYSLQLSLYQYMAEYFGFKPGNRRIIHYPHEIEGLGTPNPKTIEVPYLRREVLLMLDHLKKNRWLN